MTPAFFYVQNLGKLYFILYLLFTNYGNAMSLLTNILPIVLLFCRLKIPFTPRI